ncbi:hypothetical protein SODALDRAFT_100711 [Sodiomyces alkalinus F11]|uniref:Uncharacterized protein n=1 Tax=Sodiomyces alkalinus (strain CBS 110278 / VKM F-3762 / F11) TaxID=1314773 RepID=A0A3N2Q1J7_SODAK|nr:hypothetical protein SODALDRAFT_100711 [Sodiomyces alkalinus F11]ROT40612.1 hypothetical protein SODALDRAFT_100711 [Sodiomyces alkalinus F11]
MATYHKCRPFPNHVIVRYRAQPGVIHQSFYLHEEWGFPRPPRARDRTDGSIRQALFHCLDDRQSYIKVCIHLWMMEGLTRSRFVGRGVRDTRLEENLARALDSVSGQCINFSCSRCQTDCEIRMMDSHIFPLTIRIWKNFGRGESPGDPVWMAQHPSYLKRRSFTGATELYHYQAHRPGSIQKEWSQHMPLLERPGRSTASKTRPSVEK